MATLVVAEHDNRALAAATRHALGAAQQIDDEITVLVAGHECAAVAEAAAAAQGVTRVLVADDRSYEHGLAEELAPLAVAAAHGCTHILAAATTTGKNLLPRFAALLDVAPVSDVVRIEAADTFVRPIYAGNALATVQCPEPVKAITVRATGFEPVAASGGSAAITSMEALPASGRTRYVERALSESERPELAGAPVVISGGRAMQGAEGFALLEEIADKLGAAVGASRAAVDAGYVPNDYQVGQTGKIVAPKLYIAVGISGAIQHLAGMKDSQVIVAINKDADAPIFEVADYGLVGDLFKILPELSAALDKR